MNAQDKVRAFLATLGKDGFSELLTVITEKVVNALQKSAVFTEWLSRTVLGMVFGVESHAEITAVMDNLVAEALKRVGGNGQAYIQGPDDFKRALMELLDDPDVLAAFVPAVDRMSRTRSRERRDERRSAIRERIGIRYNESDPTKLEPLVGLVDNKLILRGSPDNWAPRIEEYLGTLETTAQESIAGLPTKARKKIKAESVPNYASLILLSGIDPEDQEAVRSALLERDELKSILKEAS